MLVTALAFSVASILSAAEPAACAGKACSDTGACAPANCVTTTTWPVTKVSTAAGIVPRSACREVNGVVWSSRPIIGGVETGDRACNGASAYGAYGQDCQRAVVMVDGLFPFQTGMAAVIDPWQKQNDRSRRRNPYGNPYQDAQDKLADRLEAARHQWLRDNGYVGGVRTFVNDAAKQGEKKAEGPITPRATIQINPQVPKASTRPFRVDARDKVPAAAGELRTAEGSFRISRPAWMIPGATPAIRQTEPTTQVASSTK